MKKLFLKLFIVTFMLSMNVQKAFSACQASFTKSISGLTVTFLNTSTYDFTATYRWTFGDGTFSTSKDPVKTYATAGVKGIRLVVYDSSAGKLECTSTAIDTFILVGGPSTCNASFFAGISGLRVSFINYSTTTSGSPNSMSYNWDFGDSTFSTIKHPIKDYSTPGVKIVKLFINDSFGCTKTAYDTIIVSSGPPSCNAHFTALTSGLTVTLLNNSTSSAGGSNINYAWSFSDGTYSTATNPVKTFSSAGYKIITLTMHDSSIACNSVFTDTVILIAPGNNCSAQFSKSVNGPYLVNLTSMSTNTNGTPAGLSYLWQFSDSTTATTASVLKTFSSGGIKWAKLFISDSSTGCYANKLDSFQLAGSNQCDADFFISVNALKVYLFNNSLNTNGTITGLNYLWNFFDGTTSTQRNPIKTFATPGQKAIQLTIFDSLQGCYSTEIDSIMLFAPLCQASFSLAIDTTTPFHFYLLNTSIIRPSSTFLWNFGDSTTSTLMTPSHTYANFGVYWVCLTVSDTVCTSVFCDSIGMDSTGALLKNGKFSFQTLDYTTMSGATGLANADLPKQYTIYPNPSTSIFNVEVSLKSASPITYQVTDISGKVILTKSANAPSGKHIESIDLSEYNSSIYFLSILSNEGLSTHKIIKN